jgi:hypothetical protein
MSDESEPPALAVAHCGTITRAPPAHASSAHTVLHAFLKDGHYNHSPQFHPIGALRMVFVADFFV